MLRYGKINFIFLSHLYYSLGNIISQVGFYERLLFDFIQLGYFYRFNGQRHIIDEQSVIIAPKILVNGQLVPA